MTLSAEIRELLRLAGEMRRVLIGLELLSHGQVAAAGSGGGESEAVIPPGEGYPPHLEYRARWVAAITSDGAESPADVVAAATEELKRWRTRSTAAPGETRGELHARIRRQVADGWTVADVALANRVTEREARKAVAAAEPERGRWHDRRARARELAGRGLTEREIARLLDSSKSSVHRWLVADDAVPSVEENVDHLEGDVRPRPGRAA